MADLTQIFSGMDQGPEKIQKDLETINAELEGAKLSLPDPSTLGIVTYNGITVEEGYYVLKTAHRTLVFTQLTFHFNQNVNNSPTVHVCTMPASVDDGAEKWGFAQQDVYWSKQGHEINLKISSNDPRYSWNAGRTVSINYISVV
ncbi:hypothetical protein [Limosilactobacillus reuteri]|uniref:hypothetical protein n=1 Tax=Limosilactobacillus reuteri TaxID=1598 RepID=UPI002B05B6BB|nr:hypothetical protein [Limosilactobacillus reuteri]